MKTTIHKANQRGYTNIDWLKSYHTFSFGHYHNPSSMHFGMLRVLNDDDVAAGHGFEMHSHQNMEIISLPLEGSLLHVDSLGNKAIIKKGEIQVMSAGSGIYHSEYNNSQTEAVKFLQIWIYTNTNNVSPRYQQIQYSDKFKPNIWQCLLSPILSDNTVWIYQQAWIFLGKFEKGISIKYNIQQPNNGVYIFILHGSCNIENHILNQRDGIGISEFEKLELTSMENETEILLIEVTMR